MTTTQTLRRPDPDPHLINARPTCANGHPWRPETTRWRYRVRPDRPGHGYSGWERDCLVCKAMANKAWAKSRAARTRSVLVDITASGEHYTTSGGPQ